MPLDVGPPAVAKLRSYIERSGMSLRAWCMRFGLDHTEISKLLHGVRGRSIRPETAQKIAAATQGEVTAADWGL